MGIIELWFGLMVFHFSMRLLGFKPDRTKLYCGIAGYSGSTPPNMANMKILGMYNIARGDDSCGIAIDDRCYKGVGKNANWVDFMENNSIPDPNITNTVIVHTRKATGGTHSAENAHPFEFYKNKNTTDPYFIGCHNGTIRNETDLKKEYKLEDYHYNVDSQLLLKIISQTTKSNTNNLQVLSKYRGGAALLFYWTNEPNTLYAWKGATKEYTTFIEERPLFYWKTDTGVYISSIKPSLFAIGGKEDTVFSFKENTLFKIKEGVIEELPYTFNREFTVVSTTYSYSKPADKELTDTFKGYGRYSILTHIKRNTVGDVLIDHEPMPTTEEIKGGKVYFWKGRYYKNGHLLGGADTEELSGIELALNTKGYPSYSEYFNPDTDVATTYYFYKGLMVQSEEALNLLITKVKDKSVTFVGDNITVIPYVEVKKLFLGFVWNTNDTVGNIKHIIANDNSVQGVGYCTGKIRPLFSNVTYTLSNGFLKEAVKVRDEKVLELPFKPSNTKEDDVENDKDLITTKDVNIEDTLNPAFEEELNEYLDVMQNVEKIKKRFETSGNSVINKLSKKLDQSYKYLDEHFKSIAEGKALEEDELVEKGIY